MTSEDPNEYPYYDYDYDYDYDYVGSIPIYVINLKSRPERKRQTIKELDNNNLKGTFIEAVNGNNLDRDELNQKGLINDNTSYRKLRKGEIGCYFSHLKCWELILKGENDYGIILEDDVILEDKFREKLNKLFFDLKEHQWDYICLGRRCTPSWFDDRNCNFGESINKYLYYPSLVGYATFAYIIKKTTIDKLLKKTFPISKPIDVVILEENDRGTIKPIVLKKDLIKVRNTNDSDTIAIK